MSKSYLDTSFRSFVKYKLNEIINSERLENEKPAQKDMNGNKKQDKISHAEYMKQMVKEFESILALYDNL